MSPTEENCISPSSAKCEASPRFETHSFTFSEHCLLRNLYVASPLCASEARTHSGLVPRKPQQLGSVDSIAARLHNTWQKLLGKAWAVSGETENQSPAKWIRHSPTLVRKCDKFDTSLLLKSNGIIQGSRLWVEKLCTLSLPGTVWIPLGLALALLMCSQSLKGIAQSTRWHAMTLNPLSGSLKSSLGDHFQTFGSTSIRIPCLSIHKSEGSMVQSLHQMRPQRGQYDAAPGSHSEHLT